MLINIANDQPKDVLKTLIEVYNDIGEFVTNLTSISLSGDHEMLENPDFEVIDDTVEIPSDESAPEGEPELDDTIDENDDVTINEEDEVIEEPDPEPEPEPKPESDEDALKKEMADLLLKYQRK